MTATNTPDPEKIWNEITDEVASVATADLWAELRSFESFQGGEPGQNLRLAVLVHTLVERDQGEDTKAAGAAAAWEAWKQGPEDGSPSGHIVSWMLRHASSAAQ
ncbi:hypothetical protein OG401_41185 [Kitasatospora purpeofusca]|uniref:hypothetical protein n=1 Tax=Kitasatospora purpeofusca TaxID=67352 RepID=UPI002251C880|nr:hypothetical protein [Kitasatospora purpeofusca]MCX4690635.1 hypothetical protein [Kitasatospora purpeofusca]